MRTRTTLLTLFAAAAGLCQFPPPPPEPPEVLEPVLAMAAVPPMPPMPPAPPEPVLAGRSKLSEDEQMKLLAMDTLLRNDPERALPAIEKLMANSSTSAALRERALGVLSRSDSPKARDIVLRVAKDQGNPELQRKAVHYLGMHKNQAALGEIYSSATDAKVKREVLRSYLISGAREQLVQAAKSESDPNLRREAIQLLGAMRADTELTQLYTSESDAAIRGAILRAFMASGNAKALIDAARGEKSPELRRIAVQHLAHMRSKEASDFLSELLDK